MTLSSYIQQYMQDHGLSRRAFALQCGVSHSYIAMLGKNRNPKTGEPVKPTLNTIKQMASGMGMTADELIRSVDEFDIDLSGSEPGIDEDVVSFPVLGEVAAGYDRLVVDDMDTSEKIDVPRSWLHGRPASDYFVLKVYGRSMYPMYLPGDKVLVLRQCTMNRSGEIGVVLYDDDKVTLKKIEYTMGEDWMRLVPLNLNEFTEEMVTGERLEHCRVLGIPRMVVRDIND